MRRLKAALVFVLAAGVEGVEEEPGVFDCRRRWIQGPLALVGPDAHPAVTRGPDGDCHVKAGKPVAEISGQLGMTGQTIRTGATGI